MNKVLHSLKSAAYSKHKRLFWTSGSAALAIILLTIFALSNPGTDESNALEQSTDAFSPLATIADIVGSPTADLIIAYTANTDHSPVRACPSYVECGLIGYAHTGQSVWGAKKDDNGWIRISLTDGKIAYMRSEILDTTEAAIAPRITNVVSVPPPAISPAKTTYPQSEAFRSHVAQLQEKAKIQITALDKFVSEIDAESDYISSVLTTTESSPQKDTPRGDLLIRFSKIRLTRLVGFKETVVKSRALLVQTQNLLQRMSDDSPTWGASALTAALQRADSFGDSMTSLGTLEQLHATFLSENKTYRSDFVNKIPSAAPSSSTNQPTSTVIQPYQCGPGVSICGSPTFDKNAYTIVTGPASDGTTLYKLVPQPGAKVPDLGYYSTEEKAVTAYKEWLSNNGY
jgi:hypothetical protein